MDLRKYRPKTELIDQLKANIMGYQPYILSDDCQTGVADYWINGIDPGKGNPWIMEKSKVNKQDWIRFCKVNQKMRNMYDSWIDSLCLYAKKKLKKDMVTVTDTAANDGYFLYKLSTKIKIIGTGYDLINCKYVYQILNQITGYSVQFYNHPYDMMRHEIPNAQKSDIVISSAIMCHLSDPLYYLAFLGSITDKILFLFSAIHDSDKFEITYDGARQYFPEKKFPICFDSLNHVSKGLVEYGLKDMGFSEIIELPYQENWLPYSWYQTFKAFIAIR